MKAVDGSESGWVLLVTVLIAVVPVSLLVGVITGFVIHILFGG